MTFPRVRATSVLATTAKYLLHLFHFVPIEVTSHVWTTKGTERERIRIRLWIRTAIRLNPRREGFVLLLWWEIQRGDCHCLRVFGSFGSLFCLGAGGLLKLRVNPSDESIARAVSTVAQLCQKSEFEKLAERMEAGHQARDIGGELHSKKEIPWPLTIYIYSSSTIFRVIEGIQQNPNFQRQLHDITFVQIISDTLQPVSN